MRQKSSHSLHFCLSYGDWLLPVGATSAVQLRERQGCGLPGLTFGPFEEDLRPGELGGEDGEPREDDEPARSGQRHQDDAHDDHANAHHQDRHPARTAHDEPEKPPEPVHLGQSSAL